jgi:phosphoribosylanthranilate isomerase
MTVRIKICGVTTIADARLAADLGADAIGLNFYSQSPRCISLGVAHQIIAALPAFVEPVALFVNESLQHAQETALGLRIRTVQLHGAPMPIPVALHTHLIPAFPVHDLTSLQTIIDYVAQSPPAFKPSAILVDAHVPGMHGGTGKTAPWHLLANFDPGVPVILAGGLNPDNVADAIRIVRPYAVDAASGVESSPGRKDADKLRRFIENARAAL